MEDIAQALRYLALLQEVQASEHGAAELYRLPDRSLVWRCKYCHGDYVALSREHTEHCPYQTALAWRNRLLTEMVPREEEPSA